jgi:adenylylsulfate kinase
MESHSRSIAKAISYRVLASTSTMLIFYLFSRDVTLSVGAGALDMVVKIGLYFFHERLWNHIQFGRPKPPEYEI